MLKWKGPKGSSLSINVAKGEDVGEDEVAEVSALEVEGVVNTVQDERTTH